MDEKILEIQKGGWIDYDRAIEILAVLEELLFKDPKGRSRHILIAGETNNGKTEIINQFYSKHLPQVRLKHEYIYMPVVKLHAKSHWTRKILLNEILEQLNVRFKPNDELSFKWSQTLSALRNVNCKIVIIDEINHFTGIQPANLNNLLYALKELAHEAPFFIIAAGTKNAYRVVNTVEELRSRFRTYELERWKLNNEFAGIVQTFREMFDLENDSKEVTREFLEYILYQSEGLLGEMSDFLKDAASNSIKRGTNSLTLEDLKATKWIRPSDRRTKTL